LKTDVQVKSKSTLSWEKVMLMLCSIASNKFYGTIVSFKWNDKSKNVITNFDHL